jgi:hypothetical protein
MPRHALTLILLTVLAACGPSSTPATPDFGSELASFRHLPGYFDLYWDEGKGRLIVRVDAFDEPFLYQSSLARGVGSNDIGLDRGQLGSTKVVRFLRSGPKVLLREDNLDYRAGSDNADETAAVDESISSRATRIRLPHAWPAWTRAASSPTRRAPPSTCR